jgi:hypothetical protein
VSAGKFGIKPIFLKDPMKLNPETVYLPRWFRGMMDAIARDERTAQHPTRVIPKLLYADLFWDATLYGFELVAAATGEDLGTPEEMKEYARQNLAKMEEKNGIDFSRVYLPLVMGGILVNDKLLMDKEDPSAVLREIGVVIEERVFEISEDDMPIYHMTNDLIMQMGHKYGFYK